jgi:hypothetical protein
MRNLTFKCVAVAAAILAFVLPAQAQAACGQSNGSYVVSCEKGVQVYRHQAKSATPQMMYSPNSATARAEQRNAATALQLEARRVAIEERRQAAEESDLIRTRRGYNRGSAYSRRYVTYSGQGFARSRFQRARNRVSVRHR